VTEAATIETPAKRTTTSGVSKATGGVAIPKFALDAIGTQATRVSDILIAAADAIEELTASNSTALPEAAKGFASTASSKLRGLADRATEEEAARLVQTLQSTARDHPVATASIGAAIGAALGIALSRLGKPAKA
jgi:ElaB/YqjD/DUF883 family membrane-anchored ribosome-binding protein